MTIIHKKPVRFALVGVLNTLIDVCVYVALVTFGWYFALANIISTSCGMLTSFVLNRNFTFGARSQKMHKQLVPFLAITLVGQWLLQPLGILVATFVLQPFVHDSLATLGSKGCGIILSLVWNYVLYKKYVFTDKSSTGLRQHSD